MSEDPLTDLLTLMAEKLDEAGIPYAITGSVAAGVHGEPVSSQDVDIVVRMTAEQARRLADSLPPRFYCNADRLEEIARAGGMVNLIDPDTGLKVDLSVLPADAFRDAIFSRRSSEKYGPAGPAFDTVTAEDLILMKLVWRKESRSQKQWDNALSVVRVKGATLDWKYLFDQSERLGVEADLVRLRDEGGV